MLNEFSYSIFGMRVIFTSRSKEPAPKPQGKPSIHHDEKEKTLVIKQIIVSPSPLTAQWSFGSTPIQTSNRHKQEMTQNGDVYTYTLKIINVIMFFRILIHLYILFLLN